MPIMPLDASVMAAVDTDSRSQRVDERCGSRWGVVHTHPQAERWAAQNLQRQGYAAYLPTHTVRIRDRTLPTLTRPVERPLFTSYLFVAVPLTLWGPIRHTLGVKRLLMSGEKPYLLPDAVWSALQAGEELRRAVQAPGAYWAPGTPCSPGNGVFTGHPAVVISVDRGKAIIAMLLFGELRQVSVDVNSLVARE
jgi:transcription antitermination factor NusG